MRKTSKIFSWILSALILVFAVTIFAMAVTAKNQGKTPTIFGHSFHVVVTGSMSPIINVNDFVVAKKVDKSQIKVGDFIVFYSADPSLNKKPILHSVTEINYKDGEILFTTKGVNPASSQDLYPATDIIGLYSWHSAVLGKIIIFFSKPLNWLFIIVIGCLLKFSISMLKRTIKEIKEQKQNG